MIPNVPLTSPPSSREDGNYLPQLDGLRAIAVFAVLLDHFANIPHIWGHAPGAMGVRLFFVLSGFLITRILLAGREQLQSQRANFFQVATTFYARRFLRIFPAYYLLLAVGFLKGVPILRADWLYFVLYLQNFRKIQWPTAHLWSLAVEEQFYLVWPALILLTPKRFLWRLLVSACALGIVFRTGLAMSGHLMGTGFRSLTPSCLDTLGGGAILAYLWTFRPEAAPKLARACGLIGLPLLIVWFVATALRIKTAPLLIGEDSILALVFVWFVHRTAQGWDGALGNFLLWKPVRYLGKISYGIYLWHLYAFVLVQGVFLKIWPSNAYLAEEPASRLALSMLATVGLAALSWHLCEQPFNRLKRFFPIRTARTEKAI